MLTNNSCLLKKIKIITKIKFIQDWPFKKIQFLCFINKNEKE